ncbi:MFS transporter [Anaerocolumna xylanovorans]|uniref:Na+/melibiose symporter n=1 Tax=Anaerocolumna xylanovorans DSM 12503 TaxID=1121345 RepID=A0A1M7YIK4_9FIRM|nr:MFS transporter [Anaerocolumna xylanovorans]SHO52467.1 Na+/melibiose symporter [Anaerocolumna xylanovorans DSM 12503]
METIKTPFPRLVAGIFIGYGLMLMGFMTTAALLVPLRVMAIDPKSYATSYGLVAGVSAFFALIGNPIGGAISDRSNVAFGRRRLWILVGSLIGSFCIMCVLFSKTVLGVVIAWSASQFFFNFSWAAYTALIPDQVEESKRGTMSGIFGVIVPVFMTAGMILINVIVNATDAVKFTTFACIGVIGPIISLFIIKEGKMEFVKKSDKISVGERLSRVFPNPKKYPEFTWALFSKFLLMMGYASSLYLTVMLGDRMHMNQVQITATYSTIMIIGFIFTAIASLAGGFLSDKIRKQKVFLYVSSVIITIGIVMYVIPNITGFFAAAVMISIGGGCFMAVDTAMVTRVLPNKKDTAKDFGIMNVANCLPQSLVPAIAPLLLSVGGWNFFYIFLALMPIIGIFTIRPIPEVGHKLKSEREVETNIHAKTIV